MVKNDVIKEVAERATDIVEEKITKKQVEAVISAYVNCVVENLTADKTEKIPLPGIGAFTAKHVGEKSGVSAINGKEWHKDAEDQLKFTISKSVKTIAQVVQKVLKNKYEDIEILDLEDKVEDILEIYIDCLYHTDKTVGIVVNKEIAEYVLDELVTLDETSIKEVCFIDNINVNEYLVSVDDDGYIRVVPIEDYVVLDDVDVVYIDMDGDINQDVIDYYVNEDKKVILFGQEDDDCDGDCENCACMSDTNNTYVHLSDDEDGNTHGFTASKSDGNSYVSYSYYTSEDLNQGDIQRILKAFGF